MKLLPLDNSLRRRLGALHLKLNDKPQRLDPHDGKNKGHTDDKVELVCEPHRREARQVEQPGAVDDDDDDDEEQSENVNHSEQGVQQEVLVPVFAVAHDDQQGIGAQAPKDCEADAVGVVPEVLEWGRWGEWTG